MTKLEKVIKKIFHKNNCHTLNITIEVLLGECDLLSQDAVIRKKWKSLFWQKEKKFKIKIQKKTHWSNFCAFKFLSMYLFMYSLYLVSIFLLLLLVYKSGFKLFVPWRLFTYTGKMQASYRTEKLSVTLGHGFSFHAN